MRRINPLLRTCLLFTLACLSGTQSFAAPSSPTVTMLPNGLQIATGDHVIATYIWHDDALPRPYFHQLTTTDGIPVTRNYPPDPVTDKGNDDHPLFHPGAWMAFGDMGAADFWRNKARVRHLRLEGEPRVEPGQVSFTVVNAWETTDDPATVLSEEICHYTVSLQKGGFLLAVDASFRPTAGPVAFGDQEEMGFGIRVSTPLSVRHGEGLIRNSAGGEQEAGTWGKSASWCAAYGNVSGRWAGINVLAHPENFRPSWFHSRDYGLIVANPFGKKAMTGPGDSAVLPDRTLVDSGNTLRLRFGLYVFSLSSATEPDLAAMYTSYVQGKS